MVAAKDLRRVQGIVDVNDMDDDSGVKTIAGETIPYDPSRVVTNASLDPRGSAHTGKEVDTGPQVVPVVGPLVSAAQPKVQQLKNTEGDAELRKFIEDLGQNPEDYGIPAASTPDAGIPFDLKGAALSMNRTEPPQASQGGDKLESARVRALAILNLLPKGCELFVGGETGHEAVELAMGLGMLIGQGLATYRGDGHYRLKQKG